MAERTGDLPGLLAIAQEAAASKLQPRLRQEELGPMQ